MRLERLAAEANTHRAVEIAEQPSRLAFDIDARLAGQRSPLELENATIGVRGDPLAALDHRRMHGRATEQWMRGAPFAQRAVEPPQAGEYWSHARDRIDAEVVAR